MYGGLLYHSSAGAGGEMRREGGNKQQDHTSWQLHTSCSHHLLSHTSLTPCLPHHHLLPPSSLPLFHPAPSTPGETGKTHTRTIPTPRHQNIRPRPHQRNRHKRPHLKRVLPRVGIRSRLPRREAAPSWAAEEGARRCWGEAGGGGAEALREEAAHGAGHDGDGEGGRDCVGIC